MTFTFKKQPKETGLAAVGNPYPNIDIKYNKKVVGYLDAPNWQTKDNNYTIRFCIKDEESFTGWKWIAFKHRPENAEDAKQWLKDNFESIFSRYEFYYMDSE